MAWDTNKYHLTLEEVGKLFTISLERIVQIEAKSTQSFRVEKLIVISDNN